MSFYDQICHARERMLISDTSSNSRDEKMKILSQLMTIAFNNNQTPDELPKVFRIRNLEFMNSDLLEWFLTYCVNVKVCLVTVVHTDYVKGRTFEVKLF